MALFGSIFAVIIIALGVALGMRIYADWLSPEAAVGSEDPDDPLDLRSLPLYVPPDKASEP